MSSRLLNYAETKLHSESVKFIEVQKDKIKIERLLIFMLIEMKWEFTSWGLCSTASSSERKSESRNSEPPGIGENLLHYNLSSKQSRSQLGILNGSDDNVFSPAAFQDANDEDDLVDIGNIEPYAAPGSLLNHPTQPTTLGQSHTGDASRSKEVNPYDNVTDSPDEPDEEHRYLNVKEMREHERMSYSDSPFDEQLDREAEKLIHAVDDLVHEATKDIRLQPSQEDVVRCTEQITKKIQELLLSAQAGRHSCFIPCSSNIFTAVNDMASLFPEEPDVDSMRVSLQLMKSSAARLQVECKSAVLPGNTVDMAFLTQQVIQCAYDIAKAAKQLVTTFSVD
ncbi:hypothetical protein ACROYT_G009345 [Oculina patagonica]